jgi:hypothetical protein
LTKANLVFVVSKLFFNSYFYDGALSLKYGESVTGVVFYYPDEKSFKLILLTLAFFLNPYSV